MRLMNQVFHPLNGHCDVVYFKYILVYSTTIEEHLQHLKKVFEILREQQLFANIKKCHFLTDKETFLGFIISKEGVQMDPEKIEVIINWQTPSTIHEARGFHGLTSFYKRFVRKFRIIISPLTDCLKGGKFV